MKTSITTSATLGIILAVASFVAMPAAHAESMSGGPLNTQSTSQATTKNESKAEVNDQSMSRGQLVTPVEPQENVPTKVTQAPAATRPSAGSASPGVDRSDVATVSMRPESRTMPVADSTVRPRGTTSRVHQLPNPSR